MTEAAEDSEIVELHRQIELEQQWDTTRQLRNGPIPRLLARIEQLKRERDDLSKRLETETSLSQNYAFLRDTAEAKLVALREPSEADIQEEARTIFNACRFDREIWGSGGAPTSRKERLIVAKIADGLRAALSAAVGEVEK